MKLCLWCNDHLWGMRAGRLMADSRRNWQITWLFPPSEWARPCQSVRTCPQTISVSGWHGEVQQKISLRQAAEEIITQIWISLRKWAKPWNAMPLFQQGTRCRGLCSEGNLRELARGRGSRRGEVGGLGFIGLEGAEILLPSGKIRWPNL